MKNWVFLRHFCNIHLTLLRLAVLTCLLRPAPAFAAPTISYVQGNYATPQSSQSTANTKFTAAQLAGDLNVVVVGWNDSTARVSSVTDTQGNAYTLAVGPTTVSGTLSQAIYFSKNIAAAAAGANTVTVSFSSSANYVDMRIVEYGGADPNNPVDVTAASSGSGTSSTSGSATTTNPTDLIFGANIVTSTTSGPGSGFTQRLLTSPDGDIAEDRMVTSAGSYSATAPLSSGKWIMQMVAFRTPGGGASAPAVTSISPSSGPTVGGTSVTITGTNFAPGATVTFGSAAATNVAVSNSTTLTATTPAGNSGAVAVTVTVNGQSGSLANGFTYTAAPTVTGVSPNTGSTSGGTSVTITGTNFATGATVTFGSAAATNVVVSNSTTLTVTTPAGSSGAVAVTVTVNGLSGSLANGFTYAPVPTTISYLQGAYATPQSPQTTVSVSFPSAQVAGDLNVAVVGWNDSTATVSSVTDTAGNSYALAIGPTVVSGALSQSIYYAKNVTAGANTVTVKFSTAAASADIRIAEYGGADPNNPVDVTAATSGSGTSSNSGSATTTNATDLIFGANIVTSITSGPGSGFTQRLLTSPDGDIVEDRMVATAGSYSATAPLSSGTWIMQMVAFRTGACSSAPPSAPGSLSATAVGVNQINLTWAPSASCIGISEYVVQRCAGTGCSNFSQLATSTTTGFTDSSVASDTPYSYQVQAIDTMGNAGPFSNVASATASSILISPRAVPLTFTRTQQFTSPGSSDVIWSVDGVTGGTSSTGTISSTGLYTPPSAAGTHTVTVSTSDLAHSASATVYVVNYPGTFTRDVDNMRTGLNPNETVLTPTNVNVNTFGKLASYPIDGVADASPLYVANLQIPGQGFHNLVYVATEHDSVYAFDADGLQSAPLWHDSFINPSSGITSVPADDEGGCTPVCDIQPEIGITGSPVIDPTTNTLYVVAKTKEVSGSSTNYVHRLHALDMTTGAEKFGGPVVISADVPGTGTGSSGGQLPFISLRENQRSALLLSNGVVYFAFASHGDVTPWHGWVLGYNAATLTQTLAFNASPNDNGSGIWVSGDGLATDSSGNLFFVTGNGTFDVNAGGSDYGDSLLRIDQTTGSVTQYFTPYSQGSMNASDLDLGSGGVTLLPDQAGSTPHPHLALTAGKDGTIHLVDRDTMGGYNPNNNNQIVQSVVNEFPGGTYTTGNFKAPVYWNGNVYYSADADYLKSFSIANAQLSTMPTSEAKYIFSYPGSTLALSSNGNTNPILWAIQRVDLDPTGAGSVGPGSLHAFDATNLANELYNSTQAAGGRDMLDYTCKWSAPLVANGQVYVASEGFLSIFGLLP